MGKQQKKNETVTIVGRGIIGLTLAYEFLNNGYSVEVVAPLHRNGEASKIASGIIASKGLFYGRDNLFAAKLHGKKLFIEFVKGLAAKTQTDPKTLFTEGVYEPFESYQEFQRVSERIYHGEFKGLFVFEIESANRINGLDLIPFVRPPIGCFYYRKDLLVDIEQLLLLLEYYLKDRGVRFFDQKVTKVSSFSQDRHGLVLERGEIVRKNVFFATGFFVYELLKLLDLKNMKMKYRKGYTLKNSEKKSLNIGLSVGRAAVNRINDKSIYGSIDDKTEADYTDICLNMVNREMKGRLLRKVELSDVSQTGELLAGVRVKASDGLPLMGRLGKTGLWISCGYYKNGIDLSVLAAKEMVRKYKSSDSVDPYGFDPGRFF